MATQDIEKLLVQFSADFRGYQREMLKLNGVTDRSARQIEQRFRRLNRSISQSMQNAGRGLTAGLGRLGAIAGVGFSIQGIQEAADSWTDLSSRVGLAVGSMDAAPASMERIYSMAQRTYSALNQTAEAFLGNATALRELGYSTKQQLDFTEALNNALVISGAKGDRAASVNNALSKAMASGVLNGDNLNTIIETGGRVAEVLAAELGVNVNQLRKVGKEGKITGQVIYSGLTKNLEGLRTEAEEMPATISDGFQQIRNALTHFVGTADKATASSSFLAQALLSVARDIDKLASSPSWAKINAALEKMEKARKAQKEEKSSGPDYFESFVAGDWKTAFVGEPGTTSRSIANWLGLGEDLNDQIYALNKLQERRLELEKQIADAEAMPSGLALLAQWREELANINKELERQKELLPGPSFEDRGRGAAFPEGYLDTVGKPKPPETPEKVDDVIKALKFEEEQIKRTAREQEIFNQLKQAGIEINSKYGPIISEMAGRIYDAEFAKRITESSEERLRSMELEAKTMGMTAEAAAYLTYKEEALNEARRLGITLTPELTAKIEAQASAYSKAAGNADQLERIAEVNDTVKDSFKGLITDIVSGVEPVDALTDALGRLADKLLDLALDDIFSALTKNGNTGGGISSLVAGLFHSGGVAGSARSSRRVSPLAFAGAPRYHSGGIAGVKPGEVPAILKRGEPILPSMGALRAIVGSRQGGGRVVVNVSNPPGMKTEQRQRQEGGRTLIDLVNAAVDERIASPATQRFFGASYGLRPVLKSR